MGRHGVRSDWQAVPVSVRDAVDDLLGAAVITTANLVGGFSPGPAVRAGLADGRTVFIKAAGESLNAESPSMHRREGEVLRRLPPLVPAPRPIGLVDDGDWVALVVEWIEGRSPSATNPVELQRMLDLLHRFAELTGGLRIDGVESVAATHVDLFGHWASLAGDPPAALDAWSRNHLATLVEVETGAVDATAGDHLVHFDARTDNMILSADGPEHDVLVDWPGVLCRSPLDRPGGAAARPAPRRRPATVGRVQNDVDRVTGRSRCGGRVRRRPGRLLHPLVPAPRPAGLADGARLPSGPGCRRQEVGRRAPGPGVTGAKTARLSGAPNRRRAST